ncbi:hypothetical protein OJF2_74300 [Aquisphaera giovannonii]|uniref:Periplasmic heavy metal sensor n=1 Tax=Aquisphaera giovannonii TaxID=406548 RepID=A0A5B9WG50_9BACT|nr:Spy/CpxP family protein refolding chaperone [Aquisphaera giovannonii]QEH38820.1 hypothetical protein OJF2_74300 [Aquisphaera giovannonii]
MGRHGHHPEREQFEGRGGFGVRRPLRFLANELGLDEKQVAAFARLLDDLKIERAQAEVDDRRAMADYADSLAGAEFDAARATGAGDRRVRSATQLRDALVRYLGQIHALLSPEQRERLAYLIRAGVLAV